ncbi:lytic transglycosylase domain-containing protein [Pararoseomonas indoligenes]|uniref:Lytic transglycosylase domain-containing protein n=1 Tax=Roseomonas indoligenes TaxID=2820811 RepID=A0A940N0B3_9PROT|nr:lytic transglycosylase domain-containing protein [Pararoseomonas indoligenes]MBP0494340.1 lytic transglycosylase domain-containing protein [Pararoseomonas indoligenes]
MVRFCSFAPLLGLGLLAACAGTPAPSPQAYAPEAGYDTASAAPSTDDRAASRAAARAYRAAAARRRYRVPGPSGDPWGPHIREAANRFGISDGWIRAIMRQETGGRINGSDGLPITSPVGAMGLMQVMPRTYERLRDLNGLGDDPYDPRDNIMAGAAYIREMSDRFGAPGFVAAYNAGPLRVEGVLSGAMILPDETVNYLARVVPSLGTPVAMDGVWAEAAGSSSGGYGSGGYGAGVMAVSDDPSLRAYEGGGLVTPNAPTGTTY